MIAPTGWGKSMMHLLFMTYFLDLNPTLNCVLMTKKKDLLTDIYQDIDRDLNILLRSQLIKSKPNVVFCVNDVYDSSMINKLDGQSIIIINIDKLINKKQPNKEQNDPIQKIKLINWKKIQFVIFDEVHNIGTKCVYDLIKYLKDIIKLRYLIGSSATPVRQNYQNQNNIRILFSRLNQDQDIESKELLKEDLNILYEITYKEAWEARIILRIKIELLIIDKQLTMIDKTKDHINGFTYTTEAKQLIKHKIIDVMSRSFRHKIIFYTANRLSCLEWYEYILNDVEFEQYSKHISFSMNDQINDEDDEDKSYEANVKRKFNQLHITNQQLINGIQNYKSNSSFSMLFVVGKATEGFNDRLTDIVFNLDPTIDRSIVLEMQKMGRTTRIADGKEFGVYVSPIIKTDNYLDVMTEFMSDFIKTISKPINDKNYRPRICPMIEYENLYKQIFNIDGLIGIDPDTIYDLVFRKSNRELTYQNCIQIIKELDDKPTTKKEYNKFCQIDKRFSVEPDVLFGAKFDWIEYLSIDRSLYYDLEECKIKIQQLLKTNPTLNNKLPSTIIDELCKLDRFPPNDIFLDYYKVPISELIKKINKPKIIKKITTI
jgi:superfamily II DNA or RNA helicase